MNCPLCVDQTLQPRFHSGIEIDVCPQCRGVWLDRGELQKLVNESASPQPVRERSAPDSRAEEKASGSKNSTKKNKKSKKKKQKSWGSMLGDILEEVID